MSRIPNSINVGSQIAPNFTDDTFALFDPIYGIGGLREVASITERDNISAERLRVGMLVYVTDQNKFYRLVNFSENQNPPYNILTTWENVIFLTTGNQTISGIKTFPDTGSFNTIQITNKKLSSYSLNSTNFFFGDNYLNFANSSSNLTGILPSGIVSGINYYAKNLNSGILLISGSGQRSIDGFSTLNLYKNESVQLVGVNNPGYTGWVTISADGGIS